MSYYHIKNINIDKKKNNKKRPAPICPIFIYGRGCPISSVNLYGAGGRNGKEE